SLPMDDERAIDFVLNGEQHRLSRAEVLSAAARGGPGADSHALGLDRGPAVAAEAALRARPRGVASRVHFAHRDPAAPTAWLPYESASAGDGDPDRRRAARRATGAQERPRLGGQV